MAEEDNLLNIEDATAEQRFILMLHDRIVKLEKDNAKAMKFLFQ